MSRRNNRNRKTSEAAKKAAAAGAKIPTDFQKAEANGGGTVEVTVQGLTIEVDPTALNGDWEVVEALAALEEGKTSPAGMVRVTRAVLGDAFDDVKEHLRGEDGRISADAMGEFIKGVFEALNLGN